MNFLFDEDQESLRDSTRGLLEKLLPPDRIRELLDSGSGLDEPAWRRGAEQGWFSMLVRPEHGGGSLTDQGLVDALVFAEETGRALAPGPFISTNVAGFAISQSGSPAQQELLPRIVSGEQMVTWCLAEELAGWDAAKMRCSLRRTADGYTLDGVKLYVESAESADFLLVVASCDGELVEVLVPATAPGITIDGHVSLDLSRRSGAVTFTEVAVPASALLPGFDAEALERQLQVAAVLSCADSVGGAERVLERTVEYTMERVQFGRTIASFQAVKHRCADLLLLLESARAATHYAALAVSEKGEDAALAVGLAKAHAADTYATIAGEGTQLHGGIAFAWEHDMHLFVRRAKANQVLFGSSSWHRHRTWPLLQTAAINKSEA